jgi:hypothetical protein
LWPWRRNHFRSRRGPPHRDPVAASRGLSGAAALPMAWAAGPHQVQERVSVRRAADLLIMCFILIVNKSSPEKPSEEFYTDMRAAFHSYPPIPEGGFRREVQPRRQHWFLNEKSGFPFRTPAFCSVSRGQRRLGEEEYRAPSVTRGLHFAPELREGPLQRLVLYIGEMIRLTGAQASHDWPQRLLKKITAND